MANPENLLTTAELSERTGLSQSWFLTHRRNATGPAFHRIGNGHGGSVRYRWSDWEAYVAACRIEPRGSYNTGARS